MQKEKWRGIKNLFSQIIKPFINFIKIRIILAFCSPGNCFKILYGAMKAGHVEHNPIDAVFSIMEILLHHIKGFHLGKVLLNVHFDEYPLLTQCFHKSVKIWMRSEDDGLKSSMPGLQLICSPCPILQDFPIDRPHLRTHLGGT